MNRALVVVDESDAHRDLLEEAAPLAAGVGAELVVFSWITNEEINEQAELRESVEQAEHTSYSEPSALGPVEQFARRFTKETLTDAGIDPEFETDVAVADDDELADEILEAAERNDCDHVFVVGRRRSPTGKAVFGDVAQRVILNFEGPVTVTMT